MVHPEQLQAHAERIRTSGVLGRSELLQRLFDFFVACSLKNHVPKEIEVALDVFGKRADFDVAQDAVVRVYIHKLRRKLDEYYQGAGKDDAGRLVIPKGEYRFVWQDLTEPAVVEAEPQWSDQQLQGETELALESMATEQARHAQRHWRTWLVGLAGVLLCVNLLVMVWRPGESQNERDIRSVREQPVWSALLDDNLPIYIVVGDYYIFGELTDDSMEVRRMVRDFDINSPTDLEQYLKNNPQLAPHYMDMSLQYLPTSVAFALRNVMPILEPNNKRPRQVQVILASDLTPTMVKSAHVIYIGLLSGMGLLREIVLGNNAPLVVGDSYDELLDQRTNKHYVSQASIVPDARSSYRDYGFFYTRTSSEGTHLLVLAGTRDVALMHVAEALTQPDSLNRLVKQVGRNANFEALFAVQALDRTNLNGRLLLSYGLDADNAATNSSPQ